MKLLTITSTTVMAATKEATTMTAMNTSKGMAISKLQEEHKPLQEEHKPLQEEHEEAPRRAWHAESGNGEEWRSITGEVSEFN